MAWTELRGQLCSPLSPGCTSCKRNLDSAGAEAGCEQFTMGLILAASTVCSTLVQPASAAAPERDLDGCLAHGCRKQIVEQINSMIETYISLAAAPVPKVCQQSTSGDT